MSWVPETAEAVEVMRGDEVLLGRMTIARGFVRRGLGLMGVSRVPESVGDGYLFPRCSSLHMFCMRFPLHMAFVDEEGRVEAVFPGVRPWQMRKGGKHALEWVGECRIQKGDVLRLRALDRRTPDKASR